jgi:hypothetical protein
MAPASALAGASPAVAVPAPRRAAGDHPAPRASNTQPRAATLADVSAPPPAAHAPPAAGPVTNRDDVF